VLGEGGWKNQKRIEAYFIYLRSIENLKFLNSVYKIRVFFPI